jgi:hypothetical protein
MHVYEVRPRKDKRGVDLISDALPLVNLRPLFFNEKLRAAIQLFNQQFRALRIAVIQIEREPQSMSTSVPKVHFPSCTGKLPR